MQVQPYLFFNGRCEEVIAYYRAALGAQVTMQLRYSDSPEPHPPSAIPPGWENKIMHCGLRIGRTEVFASDGCQPTDAAFSGFSLSLSVAGDAEARRLFDTLADGGAVTMPLAKTFFASSFGMVTDRFGVHWMVMADPNE